MMRAGVGVQALIATRTCALDAVVLEHANWFGNDFHLLADLSADLQPHDVDADQRSHSAHNAAGPVHDRDDTASLQFNADVAKRHLGLEFATPSRSIALKLVVLACNRANCSVVSEH
jgi:hypothetical protein